MTSQTRSRARLIGLLAEACELEHGLACIYLYAAFSLKQSTSENVTWEQLQSIRKWAAQLYFVASEEMLHLAQVWNILAAIGGTPYAARPNFPQNSQRYALGVPLVLEPFSEVTMQRLIYYERPRQTKLPDDCASALKLEGPERYSSVGDLYDLIRREIEAWDEKALFIGCAENQVGPEIADFPDLIKVTNGKTAVEAIEMITEQGEGATTNDPNCHYGAFQVILAEYLALAASAGAAFHPARPAVVNPTTMPGSCNQPTVSYVDAPMPAALMSAFDDAYSLMLRFLQAAFDSNTAAQNARAYCYQSILIMVRVIKPLGELLTRTDAGGAFSGLTVGPAFHLARHMAFPPDHALARRVADELLDELSQRLVNAAIQNGAPLGLDKIAANLKDIRTRQGATP